MATKTSLLGLTKPAYTEAADIAVLNTNFDLIDKAVGNGKSVRQELDNSWFINPINQRGRTTYSNGYTIDRWSLLYNDVSTLSVTSDGLKFTSGSGDCWLLQRFERSLKVGAPYTFAVQYADGTKDVISVNVTAASTYIQGAHCIYSISNAHFAIVGRDIPNGIVIQWAALYEGEYTADTLPAYVYKGYAAELAECMRYYQVFGKKRLVQSTQPNGGFSISERFAIPMRVAPTITGTYVAWSTVASGNTVVEQTAALATSESRADGFRGYYTVGIATELMMLDYAFAASADL